MQGRRKHKNRILLCRRQLRLSQEEVAAQLGKRNVQSLSCYENGHCRPSLIVALGLAAIFDVDVKYLFWQDYKEMCDRALAVREKRKVARELRERPLCRKY